MDWIYGLQFAGLLSSQGGEQQYKTQLAAGYQQCPSRANTKAYNVQYTNDLDDEMECTPTKFTDNRQVVRETVDRLEGRVASEKGTSEAGEQNLQKPHEVQQRQIPAPGT